VARVAHAGLARAAGRDVVLLGLAALGALSFAGLGGPLVALVRPRGIRPWEHVAFGTVFGFGLLGLAGFGLALAGLAFGPLLLAAAAAGICLPGAGALLRVVAAGRPAWPAGGRWWLLALGPLVPVAAAMLMPDGHIDTLTYHLAIPDQVLRLHKFAPGGTAITDGCPLVSEFVYAGAVALGRDEHAHWLQAAPFLASVALLAGWVARRAGSAAGWAAAIAILTCGEATQQLAVAKNDLSAAAFAVTGAIGLARALEGGGSWMAMSGLLFGIGCGVKWSDQIMAAVALACILPVARLRRRAPVWLVLAGLPALPWLVRSWLWFGDPLWPALSAWWPGAWWRPEDAESVAIMRGVGGPVAAFRSLLADLGPTLWREMPPVALALPFLLVGRPAAAGPERWLFGFSGLSMAACAVVMQAEWSRLAGPAFFLLAALTAAAAVRTIGGWRPWPRRAVTAAAVAACWLPLGYFLGAWVPSLPTAPYLAGLLSRDACRAQRLTTLDWALRQARDLPNPGGRMIVMGDLRIYGLPARVLAVRNYGCTWAWEMAREESSSTRIRARFHQLGVRWILHNFITEGYPHQAVVPYVWDDRMIAVWREFVERDLELAVRPIGVDNFNGGFCFWRVRDVPASVRPSYLPYLPGLDTIYNSFVSCRDVADWLKVVLEVNRRVPNVDFITDRIVQAYYVLQDWPRVWQYVQPSIAHGTIDDANYWHAAVVLAVMGQFAYSEQMMATASRRAWPSRRPRVRSPRSFLFPASDGLPAGFPGIDHSAMQGLPCSMSCLSRSMRLPIAVLACAGVAAIVVGKYPGHR